MSYLLQDRTIDLNPDGETEVEAADVLKPLVEVEETRFLSAAVPDEESQNHKGSRLSLNLKKLTLDIGGEKKKAVRIDDVPEKIEAGSELGEEEEERGSWGGKMEFIFTCIGYAVGLGNVWRFPYLAYKNGGGAFLVPYVFMLTLVGLPLFFKELAFGQYASLGPISIWKINRYFKGLGYAMVATSWLISVYYNVVISHVMCYLFASFAAIPTQLPWISCDNWWNTPDCIEPLYANANDTLNSTFSYNSSVDVTASPLEVTVTALNHFNHTLNGTGRPQTPAEEYYNHFILEISSGMEESGGVNWKLALCLLLSWIIVLICLIRGIQSLGKVVYFTAIFPYVMLTILLIRGLSLPGAGQGIIFYLKPDFTKLADARVWCDAATQIFYSLSACSGGLIAMSSYNKFNNDCLKDSLIVAIINCMTSIYAGFVIFSILGFMAMEKGVPVSEVAAGGPGLAFVVYPEAISRMPVPQMWAICFFFMMATLGFGSQFSIVEAVLSAFTDEFANTLRGTYASYTFRTSVIIFTFFMGLPMVTRGGIYLLNLVDYSISGFPLLFVGLVECIVINWLYGCDRFLSDIEDMLGKRPSIYWKATWKFLTPITIGATIVFNCIYYKPPTYDNYEYPGWAQAVGWLISLFPIMLIPAFFLAHYCANGGWALLKDLNVPDKDWGPAAFRARFNWFNQETCLTPVAEGKFIFPGTVIQPMLMLPTITRTTSVDFITNPHGGSTMNLANGGQLVRGKSDGSLPNLTGAGLKETVKNIMSSLRSIGSRRSVVSEVSV